MVKTILSVLALSSALFCALDTATIGVNGWVNVQPYADPLTIDGNNWTYENDFYSHPFYPLFILGPGHYIHPQDCYYYPFDPLKNKWTKIHTPRRQTRSCLASFSVSSQDTAIIFFSGGEAGHQLSQGGFDAGYRSINYAGKVLSKIWIYEFNRNLWHCMRGPVAQVPVNYCRSPRYDPIHDISITATGNETWVYFLHDNASYRYANPQTIQTYFYSNAVDARRGLYYLLGGGGQAFFSWDPDSLKWTRITGITLPPCPTGADDGNGLGVNAMDYDSRHDIMLYLSDANTGGAPNVQTYAFDCAARTWAQLSPLTPPRDLGRLAYNQALNVFMLAGGEAASAISRGGSARGIWFYRYATGPDRMDSLLPAPKASIDVSGNSVSLAWNSLAGADGYQVYRALVNPFPRNFEKITASPVVDTFYTDASAVTATAYSYRVCGTKGGVEGLLSRHLYTRPARVLGVVASVEETTVVKVSWLANNEAGVLGYNIYRAKGDSIFDTSAFRYEKINASPVSGTEYYDTLYLLDRIARGYIVTGVNAFGLEGAWSPAAATFPNPPEWAWLFGQNVGGQTKMACRWRPPERQKILGISLYRATTPPERQNTTGLITDSVTFWTMPPSVGAVGEGGAELYKATYFMRGLNILGQEGFLTDQISPTVTDYGYGIVMPAQRFNYADYNPEIAIEHETEPPAPQDSLALSPNPFNPGVALRFTVLKAGTASVRVHDVTGKLLTERKVTARPGPHSEKLDFSGKPSGIYIVSVETAGRFLVKRAVLMK